MELYKVAHTLGTNKNLETSRNEELSKSLYINRVPLNEELIKG